MLDEHRVRVLLERQLHDVYRADDAGAKSPWDTENDFQLKTPLCTMDGRIGIVSHHMISQCILSQWTLPVQERNRG